MPAPKKPAKSKAAVKSAAKTKPAKKPASRPAARRAAAPKVLPPQPPLERFGLIEVGGKPATVIGADVQVGQKAPHFKAQVGSWSGLDTWAEVDPLAISAGLVRIVAAVPSLDTHTCDLETRRFNAEAVKLAETVRIITISTDLPVAQRRWCGAAGVDRVAAVSDHIATEFGIAYGVLIKERRWLRRAVFVIDQNDVIRYAAYMARSSDQPDFDAVLAAARELV